MTPSASRPRRFPAFVSRWSASGNDFPQRGVPAPSPGAWPTIEFSDFRRSRDVLLCFRLHFREHLPSRHLLSRTAHLEQGQHSGDLEEPKPSTTKPLQSEVGLAMASDSQSFNQSRDPRRLNVGNAG